MMMRSQPSSFAQFTMRSAGDVPLSTRTSVGFTISAAMASSSSRMAMASSTMTVSMPAAAEPDENRRMTCTSTTSTAGFWAAISRITSSARWEGALPS